MRRGLSVLALWLGVACDGPTERVSTEAAKPAASSSPAASAETSPPAEPAGPGPLTLLRGSRPVRDLTVDEAARKVPPEVVATFDPYYSENRSYRCIAAPPFLEAFFDLEPGTLAAHSVRFVARDGYVVFVRGELLATGGACFATWPADREKFEPIGPRKDDPGPLYLVWPGTAHPDTSSHPRPWSIVTIDLDPNEQALGHTTPPGGFGSDAVAQKGHALFRERCERCHSINQEGGKLGPDLNVPQNILAYRPREQVRAYIQNPATFRYGTMPPHPDLGASELDALLRYLEVMGKHRHDPHGAKASAHP